MPNLTDVLRLIEELRSAIMDLETAAVLKEHPYYILMTHASLCGKCFDDGMTLCKTGQMLVRDRLLREARA